MAEERLIDEDKDKKYRIVVNKNGEEELLVEGQEETAEEEDVYFDVPEVTEDNEDEAVMTPEQLAARKERLEKEKKEREEKATELVDKAKRDLHANRFATALEYLERAEEVEPELGEIYATRIAAYTRNHTDYSQIVDAAESAEGLYLYASTEIKARVAENFGSALEDNIESLRNRVGALNRENERTKEERAVKFKKDRNIALIIFCATAALIIGFAVGAGVCVPSILTMPVDSSNVYLILTCLFGALAVVSLGGFAYAARRLNIATTRLRMNKRNTSTKLGREMLEEQEKLKAFLAIESALKDE